MHESILPLCNGWSNHNGIHLRAISSTARWHRIKWKWLEFLLFISFYMNSPYSFFFLSILTLYSALPFASTKLHISAIFQISHKCRFICNPFDSYNKSITRFITRFILLLFKFKWVIFVFIGKTHERFGAIAVKWIIFNTAILFQWKMHWLDIFHILYSSDF